MQSQQGRDEKTLAIACALAIFVIILAVGSGLLWAVSSAAGVLDGDTEWFLVLVVVPAALAPLTYLARAGRSA